MSYVDHPLLENKAIDMPCLAIDLGEIQLLVPAMSVAEVVTDASPAFLEEAPHWMLGSVAWRERVIPVIDVSEIALEKPTAKGDGERLVVFNSAGGSERFKFFAIRTARVPSLVRVLPDDVAAIENMTLPGMKIALRHNEATYWVPDPVELEYHWLQCIDLLPADG